ncbi:MAG: hypothetical protein H6680_07840 [Desulfobacteraceae bacterium]|nr:hypothetical protein [Desulfobacteraceae bacterium]
MKINRHVPHFFLTGSLTALFFSSIFFAAGLLSQANSLNSPIILKTNSYSSFIIFFSAFLNFTLFVYLITNWFFYRKNSKINSFLIKSISWFILLLTLSGAVISFIFIKNLPFAYEPTGLTLLKFCGFGIFINIFPILVIQRHADLSDREELPSKRSIAVFTKAVASILVLIALTALGSGFKLEISSVLNLGFTWLLVIIVYFMFFVFIEISIRAFVSIILIKAPKDKISFFSYNFSAFTVFAKKNPFSEINKSLKKYFGVDISKIWAIHFFKIAGFQLCAFLALISWLVTGMTSLSINERGVYEKFGHVEKVFKPGLHFHLPWPFGKVNRIDFGVEKRLFLAGKNMEKQAMPEARKKLDVEAATTKWEDRLWETSHGREIYFLTASNKIITKQGKKDKRGVRPYEMTNADIVIHYRTGLEDKDAIAASYNINSPEELVLRQAGRWVQSVFASSTPEDLIGTDRKILGKKMLGSLQKEMDILNTGIEITGVYFEAIHPPIEAATSFYNVQAALHDLKAQISFAVSNSKRVETSAQIKSASIIDSAMADAEEIISKATIETRFFTADNHAFSINPDAYKIENYLNVLDDISSLKKLYIVDENIPWKSGFHIDFRKLTNEPVKIMSD